MPIGAEHDGVRVRERTAPGSAGRRSRIRLAPDTRHVIEARRTVGRMAFEAGLGRRRIDDLMVAVSEAVTNAIEAQQSSGVLDDLVLTCRADSRRLEVTLDDGAGGFDRSSVHRRVPLSQAAHLHQEGGWGIQLMEGLVDRVTFERNRRGTTVHLVVDLDPPLDLGG